MGKANQRWVYTPQKKKDALDYCLRFINLNLESLSLIKKTEVSLELIKYLFNHELAQPDEKSMFKGRTKLPLIKTLDGLSLNDIGLPEFQHQMTEIQKTMRILIQTIRRRASAVKKWPDKPLFAVCPPIHVHTPDICPPAFSHLLIREGIIRTIYVSDSLEGAAYQHFVQLLDGISVEDINACRECNTFFHGRRNKTFCSKRCAQRYHQRRYRETHPEEYKEKQRKIMKKRYDKKKQKDLGPHVKIGYGKKR